MDTTTGKNMSRNCFHSILYPMKYKHCLEHFGCQRNARSIDWKDNRGSELSNYITIQSVIIKHHLLAFLSDDEGMRCRIHLMALTVYWGYKNCVNK